MKNEDQMKRNEKKYIYHKFYIEWNEKKWHSLTYGWDKLPM